METENYLEQLKSCQTEQEFKEVWNSSVFNWKYFSDFLCKYCSKYFNIWWNADKFNWKNDSDYLCLYCSKYFNIWWNADKFNWKDDSDYLCKYCHKYFNIWWNADKFNWYYSGNLRLYCQDYKYIWSKGYIKWKLKTT